MNKQVLDITKLVIVLGVFYIILFSFAVANGSGTSVPDPISVIYNPTSTIQTASTFQSYKQISAGFDVYRTGEYIDTFVFKLALDAGTTIANDLYLDIFTGYSTNISAETLLARLPISEAIYDYTYGGMDYYDVIFWLQDTNEELDIYSQSTSTLRSFVLREDDTHIEDWYFIYTQDYSEGKYDQYLYFISTSTLSSNFSTLSRYTNVYIGFESYSSIYSDQIAFISPQNGQTGNDFNNWYIETGTIYDTTTSTLNPIIKVYYGYSSSSYTFVDSSLTTVFENGDFSIPKSRGLIDGSVVYAQAKLVDDDGVKYATQQISFTISSSSPPFEDQINFFDPYLPANAGMYKPANDECDAYEFGLFSSTSVQAVMCESKKKIIEILAFIFAPSKSSIDNITGKAMSFVEVFPFNLFAIFTLGIKQEITSSTQSVPSEIVLPIPFTSSTVTLISSSSFKAQIGETNYNNFRNMIKYAWYITLMIGVIVMSLSLV